MSELTTLRLKRGNVKGQMTRLKSFLDKVDQENLSKLEVLQIRVRLEKAEPLLSQFEDIQTDIEFHLAAETEDDVNKINIPQIEIDERSSFETDYYSVISKMKFLISSFGDVSDQGSNLDEMFYENVSAGNRSNTGVRLPPSNQQVVYQKQSIRLPELKLPNFNGSYEKWLEFRDAFQAIVHDNPQRSNVEKFYYLKSYLEGEPLQAIANLQVTNDNYSIAWSILTDRYENKRLIVYNYVKALFDCPSLSKESHSDLRKIYDLFNKNLRSLKSLGLDVEHWDTLIVYMITNKFDSVTRREWESYSISGKLPVLDDVNKFLKTKCELLEKLEIAKKDAKVSNKLDKVKCHASTTSDIKWSCYYCRKNHSIYKCFAFKNLNVRARLAAVEKLKLCMNCLSSAHVKDCPSPNSCRHCGARHNSLLHVSSDGNVHSRSDISKGLSDQTVSVNNIPNNNTGASYPSTSTVGHAVNQSATLSILATAKIRVLDSDGKVHIVRTLLDPGSQSNLVCEELVNKLRLPKDPVNFQIMGVGEALSTTSCSNVNITIMSNVNNDFSETIPCLVVSKITQHLPAVSFDISQWNIPNSLRLADESFNLRDSIQMLLGVDIFYRILLMKQIRYPDMPVLQKTRLGWIVGGYFTPNIRESNQKTMACLSVNETIDQNLTKFWELEECQMNRATLSESEQLCEEHFVNNFFRDSQGRFIVKFPFKENLDQLGFSRDMAYKRLLFLEKRLLKNDRLKEDYVAFLNEYKELGHMTKVEDFSMNSTDSNKCFYLPHHAVVKESSLTTKVRVVFDASAQTDTGVSLNDVQHVGPTIQKDLLSILLNFRIFPYVINADITKMYRQVLIHPHERSFQRILWKNPDDSSADIECFELNTVTYGCASSPFLAVRCLYQLGLDFKDKFPEASEAILNCFYLDDLLTGEFSPDKLLQLQREITFILNSGGFKLRKWLSNKPELMNQFEVNNDQSFSVLYLGEEEQNKTLGIFWKATQDTIHYSIKHIDPSGPVTKRVILSVSSQIFDPLGLLGPIVVVAKLILQSLWQEKLTWDEPVPHYLSAKWLEFCNDLKLLNQISIPRHVLDDNWKIIHIHAFADASERAYGGCVYLVNMTLSGAYISSYLILSKSRVAPIKRITLPRLELCAAVVASKLVEKVKKSIRIEVDRYFYWTDSSIALCWIKGCPSRWKTFVANRVSQIQNTTSTDDWYHVRSENNPADCLSRGVSASFLLNSELWWKGPKILFTSPDIDDISFVEIPSNIPEQKILSHHIHTEQIPDFDFNRYSSLHKLQRVIAYCLRFYKRVRFKIVSVASFTVDELNKALILLVRMSQIQSFTKDYLTLTKGNDLTRSSKVLCLNPYLDDTGLLRVGGRIQKAHLSENQKHPIILHHKHHLTSLILLSEHVRLLHCGPQQLLYSIRQQFWPICGRSITRYIVKHCLVCFKANPTANTYSMGNLPESRVSTFQPVFTHTGLDYAGPVSIRDRKTRNPKFLKGYICIFICMTTKCIHLDVVTDLTTQSFLSVLKRFVARRGKPVHFYSDNSTTFLGANSILLKFLHSNSEEITSAIVTEGMSWHFNPPKAPNFGGLWEAGVKSIKFHLKRVIGGTALTYEDLSTVLIQIEGVLNSRPLSPMSADSRDMMPLTPAHFLVGKPLTAIPEEDHTTTLEGRLSRYQRLQVMVQHFWKRWNTEYISELQSRLKWRKQYPNFLKVGSLVIMKEDNLPVCKWKIGRVIKLHPGPDNVTRVASIMCADRTVCKRAITKLCTLPIDKD